MSGIRLARNSVFIMIFSLESDVKITEPSDVVDKARESIKGFLENYD